MTCKDCGQPIHWAEHGTENGGAWYHASAAAVMACPGTGLTEPAKA